MKLYMKIVMKTAVLGSILGLATFYMTYVLVLYFSVS
jgi:hypothetical protein